MTQQQKRVNERFFKQIAAECDRYLWPNERHIYEIENGIYIAPNQRGYDDIKRITPSSFHNRVRLR